VIRKVYKGCFLGNKTEMKEEHSCFVGNKTEMKEEHSCFVGNKKTFPLKNGNETEMKGGNRIWKEIY